MSHGVDVSSMTAVRTREGLLARDFTAVEVADAALARIDAIDPSVHAFNQVTPELAIAAAEKIDRLVISTRAGQTELPPLAGVPAAFKDNMNLVGTHTTCGSRILAPYRSVYDCTAVRRLLARAYIWQGLAWGCEADCRALHPDG